MSMLYTFVVGGRTVHAVHALPHQPVRYDIRGDARPLASITFDHHGQVTFELAPGQAPEQAPARGGTHTATLTTQELNALRWAARIVAEDPDGVPAQMTGEESAALQRARRKLDACRQPPAPGAGR